MDEFNFDLVVPEELKEMGDVLNKVQHIPREINRKMVAAAFHDAFELIGGTPRLAHWAHTNEGEFYKLYSKLMPTAASQDFNLGNTKQKIIHSIPRTVLDGEVLEAEFEEHDA